MKALLTAPLSFLPAYQCVVWGGRRMAAFRDDLPDGPIGESWDLADHDRGMSVVASGPLAGRTLRALTQEAGRALVGAGFSGGEFPLLVKLIDASDRLSVQVHPDDERAVALGVGPRGKTECWLMLGDGGELFVGLKAGVDRVAFEAALAAGTVEATLRRFETRDGDFYFLPARTLHALGKGCLLYEVQQTCDVTFRVYDWGRLGLNGRPRETHVVESLRTIDFEASNQAVIAKARPHAGGGTVRCLAQCAYFEVEERRGTSLCGGDEARCSVVVALEGRGTLRTAGGSLAVAPMQTVLVPAVAGEWRAEGGAELRVLVARPVFG